MEGIRGMYVHYKGGLYEVLGASHHTETREYVVVYRDMEGTLHHRPYDMFFGFVDDGPRRGGGFMATNATPRFRYVGPKKAPVVNVKEREMGGECMIEVTVDAYHAAVNSRMFRESPITAAREMTRLLQKGGKLG